MTKRKRKQTRQPEKEERIKIAFDKDDPVDRFLYTLRRPYPRMICSIFLNGGCFELYRILKERWPNAICYYASVESHIYTKIGLKYYDIRGAYSELNRDAHIALSETIEKAKKWREGLTVGWLVDCMYKDLGVGEDKAHDPREFDSDHELDF
jgi:hypothetical protein